MTGSTSETSAPAASKPVLNVRAALIQFTKCLGLPLLIAAVVFLGVTRGKSFGGVFVPIGQAIAGTVEFVLSAFALVVAYNPGGLFLLGAAFIAGCACYFVKTEGMTRGSTNKIDTLARIVGWAGVAGVALAMVGGISHPAGAIRMLHGDPDSLSIGEQAWLLSGRGGDMNYMNCRRIAEAYLSAGAQTQLRLAGEVNGVKVKAGQHPAQHCQMFSFNKVLYGYENSKVFAAKRGRNPD